MIVYRCPHCKRPLEVNDELAGQRAACPHCGQVSEVPAHAVRADGVPVARPAGGVVDVGRSGDEEDRAAAMGLPPDSGPEQHVLTVHPVVFRAKPLRGLALVVLIGGGLCGAGFGLMSVQPWLLGPGLIAAAVGGCWWGWLALQARGTALVITTKRTTEKRGWFGRATKEILHDKVQDIQVTQSFPQRMLGVGTVGVSNAGEAGVEIEMHDIPNPRHIRDVIDAYREVG